MCSVRIVYVISAYKGPVDAAVIDMTDDGSLC